MSPLRVSLREEQVYKQASAVLFMSVTARSQCCPARTGPSARTKEQEGRLSGEVHYGRDLSRLQDGSWANKMRLAGQSVLVFLCGKALNEECHCDKLALCCVFRVSLILRH